MKHFTNFRWLLLSLLFALGVGNAWGASSTVTASKITSSSATWTGSANESWSVTVNGGATNQNVTNSYAQVGTSKSPSTSMTFSTSGLSGTITSIVVDCAAYQGKATLSATVGGSNFGTQSQSVPSWSSNTGGEVTFTGSATGTIVITMTNGSGGRAMYIKSITVTYTTGSSETATTTTIDASGITNTDIHNGTSAGTLSASVTETESGDAVSGATVTWSSSDTGVATINNSGVVTLVAAGTTTITATYAGTTGYSGSSDTYEMTVIDSYAKGQVNNPFTVAEAITYITDNCNSTATTEKYYVTGIVSAFQNTSIMDDGTNYRYFISDDGTTTSQLLVYRGKGLNEQTFSNVNDLLVGDEVTVCGPFQKYNSTPEIASGNYLYAWNRPSAKEEAGIAYSGDLTFTKGDAYTLPTFTNTHSLPLATYESSDETVATVDEYGAITLTGKIGTATITVTTAETTTYTAGEATCVITVNGIDPGLEFATASYSFGFPSAEYDAFTGQAVTNPNNLPVTYSTTNQTIAAVASDGTVTLQGKVGTVTIKATYTTTNESNYASATVSYTITISTAASEGTIDLTGSKRTLSFTDFSGAPSNYNPIETDTDPINVDGTMNGVTSTYQWTGLQVMVHNHTQLQLKAGKGSVTSWPIKSDEGYRVRVYVQTQANGAKSTLSIDEVEVATVEGLHDEYVLEGSTSATNNSVVTITANTNALYIKQIDLIPICQDYPNLSLSESSVTVASNETVTIPTLTKAAGYDGTIVWSSSSETVATVNPSTGAVTINSTGSTIITATATETDNYTTESVSYLLTVNPDNTKGTTYFHESFQNYNNAGGNDGSFNTSGNTALNATTIESADETWNTPTTTYPAKSCVRMGSSSTNGNLTSGAITISGSTAILTFRAAGWATGTNSFTISATNCQLNGTTNISLENGEWNNYTIEITDITGDITLTFSGKRGYLDEIYVMSSSISTTITAAEYSTYVVPEKIVVDNDTKVYIVTEASSAGATLSEVAKGTVLPAGAAVVLKGAEGIHTFAPSSNNADALTGNLLQAATEDITCDASLYGRMYVLNKVNDKVGFYRLKQNSVLVEGRAYLIIDEEPSGEAKTFLPFNFTEETSTPTAIEQPVVKEIASDVIYNLNGQRVTNPTRGLYIIGGKKVFIK